MLRRISGSKCWRSTISFLPRYACCCLKVCSTQNEKARSHFDLVNRRAAWHHDVSCPGSRPNRADDGRRAAYFLLPRALGMGSVSLFLRQLCGVDRLPGEEEPCQ